MQCYEAAGRRVTKALACDCTTSNKTQMEEHNNECALRPHVALGWRCAPLSGGWQRRGAACGDCRERQPGTGGASMRTVTVYQDDGWAYERYDRWRDERRRDALR
eukprot:XP_001702774.1 predicted protein [Chlamydomonas reinhardtii]